VTEPAGPAAGTWVVAVDSTGRVQRATQADPAGHYELLQLEQGNYTVLFLDPKGINATEFYDDALDPSLAVPVVVTGGGQTTADADLQP